LRSDLSRSSIPNHARQAHHSLSGRRPGRVVKGVNFVGLRDAGDPVEIARRYNEQGADELTFLDITASSDERDLILHVVEEVAAQVFIPSRWAAACAGWRT